MKSETYGIVWYHSILLGSMHRQLCPSMQYTINSNMQVKCVCTFVH
jgi:hypothetical protein